MLPVSRFFRASSPVLLATLLAGFAHSATAYEPVPPGKWKQAHWVDQDETALIQYRQRKNRAALEAAEAAANTAATPGQDKADIAKPQTQTVEKPQHNFEQTTFNVLPSRL